MNVSNSPTSLNSYVNNQRPQNPNELTQGQREVITDVAAHKTTQDKIDTYVQGTENTNETYDGVKSTQVQNYLLPVFDCRDKILA